MRIALRSYRQLVAWQRAANLGIAAYRIASLLPSSERFGLRSQIQRAAVSIAANIAEGYGRGTRGEYVHFLHIAKGSLRELDTHIYFVEALGFVKRTDLESTLQLVDGTGAVLDGLIRSLKSNR
jgi:four helix bundle protein